MPYIPKRYRSVNEARTYRNEQRKGNYAQTRKNAFSSGLIWTKEEIEMILDTRLSDREISRIIGRSVQSIQVKRSKILKRSR